MRGALLGVHDGVHVLGSAQYAQFGHRLVGGDDQLHARPLGRHGRSPVTGSVAPPDPVDAENVIRVL